jgi:N-acetyl-anhydromuramyl-L-alanine amidase AmpD
MKVWEFIMNLLRMITNAFSPSRKEQPKSVGSGVDVAPSLPGDGPGPESSSGPSPDPEVGGDGESGAVGSEADAPTGDRRDSGEVHNPWARDLPPLDRDGAAAFLEAIDLRQSPHHSSRKGADIDSILIHYTAGSEAHKTVKWFQMDQAKVSSHYVTGRKGELFQCVDLKRRGWDAGKMRFPKMGQEWDGKLHFSNTTMVGIEIANYGLLVEDDEGQVCYERGGNLKSYSVNKYGPVTEQTLDLSSFQGPIVDGLWEEYSVEGLHAVIDLCAALVIEFGIPLDRIIGHEDVAYPVGRKTDPGPAFPWNFFKDAVARRAGVPDGWQEGAWRYHKS